MKHNINRRQILIGTAGAVSASLLSNHLYAYGRSSAESTVSSCPAIDNRKAFAIASRAIEVAQAQGANYTDSRVTRKVSQGFTFKSEIGADVFDGEYMGFCVRALVDGYWGFAASPYWDEQEAVALAEEAVRQARANASKGANKIEWNAIAGKKEEWIYPGVDPMSITIEEKIEFANAWRKDVSEYRDGIHQVAVHDSTLRFNRYEWWFCNSEGSELRQTFFDSSGYLSLQAASQSAGRGLPANIENIHMQMGGWDVLLKANIKDKIPYLIDKSMETAGLSVSPVDIGRSNLIMDAPTAGRLISSTFAKTTQLDVALGNEANAGGTSYLGPELTDFLGKPVANQSVTITANRSDPSGLATRKWDDEGVTPESFEIVKDGVLMNYQTNRELSPALNDWYASQGVKKGSLGCSSSASGLDFPMIFPPNLELSPSVESMNFEDLVRNTEKGYALFNYHINTSFQGKDGFAVGSPYSYVREIVNGKLGNFVGGLGIIFNTDELWKNVMFIGDTTTMEQIPVGYSKGEPDQYLGSSVKSGPISIKDVAIIDPSRRA